MSVYDVKRNLIYMNTNFGTQVDSITILETSGLSLYNLIQIITNI